MPLAQRGHLRFRYYLKPVEFRHSTMLPSSSHWPGLFPLFFSPCSWFSSKSISIEGPLLPPSPLTTLSFQACKKSLPSVTWRSTSLRMILSLSYLPPHEGTLKVQIIRPLPGHGKFRNHFNMGGKRECLNGMCFGNLALFLQQLKLWCITGQDASSSSIFYCLKDVL